LEKQEPIEQTINVHERCDTPVELIQSKQWFIKMLIKKKNGWNWGAK
jgi:valyl-tRNA synthetase